jgi:hypothetical protein
LRVGSGTVTYRGVNDLPHRIANRLQLYLAALAFACAACPGAKTQSDGVPAKLVISAPHTSTIAQGFAATSGDAGSDASSLADAANTQPAQVWPWEGWPAVSAAQSLDQLIGFSADDAYLGYQGSTGDAAPPSYWFYSLRKPPLYFEDFNGQMVVPETEESQERRRVAFDKVFQVKLKKLGADTYANSRKLRGPFPFADINFAYRIEPHEDLGSITVRMGGVVRGEEPVLPVALVLGPSPLVSQQPASKVPGQSNAEKRAARLEWIAQFMPGDPDELYANVTHDGSEIGFVAQASGNMWVSYSAQARRNTAELISGIYNDTALRHHKAGAFAKSAVYFAKASEIAPRSGLFKYNLACAQAQLLDPATEATLTSAIALGGPSVRGRVAGDHDFDKVRSEAWFVKLIGGTAAPAKK